MYSGFWSDSHYTAYGIGIGGVTTTRSVLEDLGVVELPVFATQIYFIGNSSSRHLSPAPPVWHLTNSTKAVLNDLLHTIQVVTNSLYGMYLSDKYDFIQNDLWKPWKGVYEVICLRQYVYTANK